MVEYTDFYSRNSSAYLDASYNTCFQSTRSKSALKDVSMVKVLTDINQHIKDNIAKKKKQYFKFFHSDQ